MNRLIRVVFLIILAALCVSVWAPSALSRDKETIRVRGLATVAGLLDGYAKEYMRINPHCAVVVSGGSQSRLDELLKGHCEVAMHTPWIPMDVQNRAREKGMDLKGTIIGWGGLVVIVNEQNPLDCISLQNIKNIFSGAFREWDDLNGPTAAIKPFIVSERRSAIPDFMENHFIKARLTRIIHKKISYQSVIAGVASHPHAIGVIRFSDMKSIQESGYGERIKALSVRKHAASVPVKATRKSIDEGAYPFTRPYYIYFNAGALTSAVDDFVVFCALKNPRPLVIIEQQGARMAVCMAQAGHAVCNP
jgi:phosphate transport system substrate-binding protein